MGRPVVSEYVNSREQRILDLTVASTIGVVALAGGAVTGTVMAVRNRSRPLLTQRRQGLHGELYPVIKLRTMDDGGQLLHYAERIRDRGLDETPQFINVLLGQMSVVGYRPLLPVDLNHATQRLRAHYPDNSPYSPGRWLALREQAKPGITGPSQTMPVRPDAGSINHLTRVVAAECSYLEMAAFSDDMQLIFRTPPALWNGHNATVSRPANENL